MIHRLTEKDVENRTAVCSVDGEVRIYRAGRGWVCAVKSDRLASRYSRRQGRALNPHKLSVLDTTARRATCSECEGWVDVVPWGRGWLCRNRASELGRRHQQAEPQSPCRDCLDDDGTWVNLVDGACPRCAKSLNAQLLEMRSTARELADVPLEPGSFTLLGVWSDPYQMPNDESVVPGWKTIGAQDPVGV